MNGYFLEQNASFYWIKIFFINGLNDKFANLDSIKNSVPLNISRILCLFFIQFDFFSSRIRTQAAGVAVDDPTRRQQTSYKRVIVYSAICP